MPNVGEGVKQQETPTRWDTVVQTLWENPQAVFCMAYNTAVLFLDIYLRETKTCPQKDYTQMMIAALLTIERNPRHYNRCPSIGEWINNCKNSYSGIPLSSKKGMNY